MWRIFVGMSMNVLTVASFRDGTCLMSLPSGVIADRRAKTGGSQNTLIHTYTSMGTQSWLPHTKKGHDDAAKLYLLLKSEELAMKDKLIIRHKLANCNVQMSCVNKLTAY